MSHNEQTTYDDLWEPFIGRPFPAQSNSRVRVTLDPRHAIYLNKAAYAALGEPRAVEILYSKKLNAIGLMPSDLRAESSFPVHPKTRKGNIYGYRIQAAAFMHDHRLRVECMVQFNKITIVSKGMMNLPLSFLTRVTKGAR